MFSSLNKIVDRIGEIFNVFDFSYIVSGIASLAVISYGLWRYNLLCSFDNDLFNVVAVIIFTYICGLISFVIGKRIRFMYNKIFPIQRGRSRFMSCFNSAIQYVNNRNNQRGIYLNRYMDEENCRKYYVEMWSYLRGCEKAAPALKFINRFWVMQAVYEGLATSFLLGTFMGCILYDCNNCCTSLIIIIGFLASFCFCCYEGTRYAESQIIEVVIAYERYLNT